MSRYDLIGVETQLFERYPALADRHANAVHAGAAKIRGLIERTDAVRGMDADAFTEHVASIQRTALAGYAASVRGILPGEEVERWISARDALKLTAYDALLGEVDAPGAASLLDALEAVNDAGTASGDQTTLDQALDAVVDRCSCGYASTRNLPKRTCYVCAQAVTAAWNAEERRVLLRLPAVRQEVDRLLDELVDRLAEIKLNPAAEWSVVEHAQRKARRRLARLNRAARNEIFDEMLTTWRELAVAASHDSRPIARSVAKGAKRSGLGTARLSAVALPGNAVVEERAKKRAQTR
ncbi:MULTISPECIES: hypothetical protein [unclassified Microbacterium]|uniref:hypothetical protein n=1 Tax=unclassified Microbacterium TaxID=2609290 RepID=UPI00109C73A5|nr:MULTISPECIES: hypothetical protein [unclassified Microbacterium]